MKRVLIFITTAILLTLFGLAMPVIKVNATTINDTPSSNSIFNFISSEEVSTLDPTCKDEVTGAVPTFAGGTLAGLGQAGEYASSGSPFTDFACAYISGNLDNLVRDNSTNNGLVNITSNLSSALLDQRPVSTQNYLQDKIYALSGKVNAADPAPYYPGPGSQLLEPIQSFWGWSVNVVMSFLILIVIGIAFAIVFRQKIGGKEMVTIQSAIPSIAMAMILVPLSYAISGVFIDLISLGTNAIHSFFFAPGAPARSLYEDATSSDNCPQGATVATDDPCQRGLYVDDYRMEVWNIRNQINVSEEIEGVANTEIAGQGVNSFIIMRIIAEVLNLLPLSDGSPAYWLGQIINLIVGLLMIWIGIKIAWRLLKAYVTLVLYPIVSPFIFALVAVPGNSTKVIADYAKTMLGASLMYIVTYAMFIVTFVFTSGVLNSQIPNFQRGIFTPPMLGLKSIFDSIPEGSSKSLTDIMFAFIGLVVYFAIPKTLDDINEKFGGKMSLPSLLTNAWDSAKESWNVTTKGAPAVAARATQLTLRGGRSAVSGAVNLPYNLRRLRDKATGLPDDNPRSAIYQRRQDNLRKRQELLAKLDDTEGDPTKIGERRRLQAQLALLDAQEAIQGKEFSSKTEEGKDRSLSYEIKYNGPGGGSFVFEQGKIKEIYQKLFPDAYSSSRYTPGGRPTLYHAEPIGLLVITAENISLGAKETLVFGDTIKNDKNVDVFNKIEFSSWRPTNMDAVPQPSSLEQGSPVFGKGGKDYFELSNTSEVKVDSYFRVRIGGTDGESQKTEAGKTITLPLVLIVENNEAVFTSLFGKQTPNPATNRVDPNSNFIGGALSQTIQTSKRAVKIPAKGVSSKAFRIKLSKANG